MPNNTIQHTQGAVWFKRLDDNHSIIYRCDGFPLVSRMITEKDTVSYGNAAHIVRCWNEYYQLKESNVKLLEAVKLLKSAYDNQFILSAENYNNIENLLK